MKAYIEVQTDKELPEVDGSYFTIKKGALIGQWYSDTDWDNYPDTWLKTLPLEELMVGFAEWCDDLYWRIGTTNIWTTDLNCENTARLTFTTQELLIEYLKLKGIQK